MSRLARLLFVQCVLCLFLVGSTDAGNPRVRLFRPWLTKDASGKAAAPHLLPFGTYQAPPPASYDAGWYAPQYNPKYYGSFHGRFLQDYGYPQGDLGLRGTAW